MGVILRRARAVVIVAERVERLDPGRQIGTETTRNVASRRQLLQM
jgi:hypothetical protein